MLRTLEIFTLRGPSVDGDEKNESSQPNTVFFYFVFQVTSQTARTCQDGKPGFVARDVDGALGFSETVVRTRHLDNEKMTVKLTGISRTNPMGTLINESGLL
jgi:prophage antirepressor-like protein